LNLTIVFGVLSIFSPSDSLSKYVTTGARLLIFKSQISILPSLATDAKQEDVIGDQAISFT
jgi:hypothetical protein